MLKLVIVLPPLIAVKLYQSYRIKIVPARSFFPPFEQNSYRLSAQAEFFSSVRSADFDAQPLETLVEAERFQRLPETRHPGSEIWQFQASATGGEPNLTPRTP